MIHQFDDAELSNPPYNRANEHRGCHRVHASVTSTSARKPKIAGALRTHRPAESGPGYQPMPLVVVRIMPTR